MFSLCQSPDPARDGANKFHLIFAVNTRKYFLICENLISTLKMLAFNLPLFFYYDFFNPRPLVIAVTYCYCNPRTQIITVQK